MVTASCRIGYDFSTPEGPLTMKLAETPSRSAGLIISVFGVASSPMASLLAGKNAGGRAKRTRARRPGQGAAGDRSSRPCLEESLLFRGSAVLPRRQLRQLRLEERLPLRFRVLIVQRDHRGLSLVHGGKVLALHVRIPVRVRVYLADGDRVARRRNEPELVDLAGRRRGEAVGVQADPRLPVRLLAPGGGAPGVAGGAAALAGAGGLQDDRGPAWVSQLVDLGLQSPDLLLQPGQQLLLLLDCLLRLRQLLARLGGLGRKVAQQRHGEDDHDGDGDPDGPGAGLAGLDDAGERCIASGGGRHAHEGGHRLSTKQPISRSAGWTPSARADWSGVGRPEERRHHAERQAEVAVGVLFRADLRRPGRLWGDRRSSRPAGRLPAGRTATWRVGLSRH